MASRSHESITMAVGMSRQRTRILSAGEEAIAEGARLIGAGKLVAFPTETVYGLGADATSDRAVAALFAAKDRPRFNPLIVHFADAEGAARTCEFDATARRLTDEFWPGPLTLVLRRRPETDISLLVSAGLDTIAVRVPGHPVAEALLRAAPCPVAAPSANPSGAVSPTSAAHVAQSLEGRCEAIIDGGTCPVGIESTVVDLSQETPMLLRPGGVTAERIEAVVGPLGEPRAGRPRSPGMLERHYAPGLPLRMGAHQAGPGEAMLAFGPDAPEGEFNLSPSGDLEEATANLFAMLRAIDRPGFRAIAVMPIPDEGLGRAINDRLRRAATPGE